MKKKQTKKVVAKKAVSGKDTKTNADQATMIVKIISVFEFIGAGFCILFGLILLFGGQFLEEILRNIPVPEMSQIPVGVLSLVTVIVGVVFVILGIIFVFLAKALWDHKNWARIVFIVFSSIGVLTALLSLPQGIVGLILHGLIVYFLAFNKDVIAVFQ